MVVTNIWWLRWIIMKIDEFVIFDSPIGRHGVVVENIEILQTYGGRGGMYIGPSQLP